MNKDGRADANLVLRDIMEADREMLSFHELLLFVMREMGGPEGMAKEWARCFRGSEEHPNTQARMLSDVFNGLSKILEKTGTPDEDDPELLKAKIKMLIAGAEEDKGREGGDNGVDESG